MDANKLDILIDAFILENISDAERKLLLDEIKKNDSLKAEINFRRDLIKSTQYLDDLEIKTFLNQIPIPESKPESKTYNLKIILFSLLLMAAFSILLTWGSKNINQPKNNPIPLAAKYFEPIPISIERGELQKDQLIKDLYHNSKFQESINQIDINQESNPEILLINGMANMELLNYSEAIPSFDKIISMNNYYFLNHAQWFKALSLIALNKNKDAIILLENLTSDPGADHYNDAISLLKELK